MHSILLFASLGLALAVGLWLHRCDARVMATPRRFDPIVDGLPAAVISAGYGLLVAVTGRPALAGLAMAGGAWLLFMLNRLKEHSFHEPIVFLDFTLIPQIVRHPRFYVPYLFPKPVVVTGAVAVAGLTGLWLVEEPVEPAVRLAALGVVVGGGAALLGWLRHLLGPAGQGRALELLGRLAPTFDAKADFARLGLFASMLGHALYHVHVRGRGGQPGIARPGAVPSRAPVVLTATPAPHLVLVQAESFCDIRRHLTALPTGLLAGLDRLRSAGQGGRFLVPNHGAYTMRTEFSVLTGLGPAALGSDAFNPYFTGARQPVPSLATRLRQAGYETRCLHPFQPTFFGRHNVMPNLGFAHFESLDAFAGAERAGPYVADAALGRRILDRLAGSDGPGFVFAITIEAHGPWTADRFRGFAGQPPTRLDPLSLYLWHLEHMDALFTFLAAGLARLARPAILCGYGDHVPGLPGVGRPGIPEPTATDWFLWDSRGGCGADRDLRPEELAEVVLEAINRDCCTVDLNNVL